MIKKGTYTALITPFLNGNIDFESLKNLISFQLKNGIDGFVVNGTTAESPTLESNEVEEIFNFVKKNVPSDFPIILGTGTNSTKSTCDKTKLSSKWGASAALVVVPYYNKPTQEGLFLHFKSVAESADIPVILYNVPGRTVVGLEVDTIKRLSNISGIFGIKDATGDLSIQKSIRESVSESFIQYSGDDESAPDYCLGGGHGVISVLSHIIPKEFATIIEMSRNNKKSQEFARYIPLAKAIFAQSNPIPVKSALQMMGIIKSDEMRLPLCRQNEDQKTALKNNLKEIGLV